MSAQRLRVVMAVTRFPKFSETFIVAKFLQLLSRGWDVHVACERSEEDQWALFPSLRAPELEARVHVSDSIRAVAERVQADIVHFEFGELARRKIETLHGTGVKTVTSFRGPDICFIGLDEEPFYEAVWRHADAFHFLGEDLRRRAVARGCPADARVAFIPPALGDDVLRMPRRQHRVRVGSARRPLRIACVARLHWMKGFEYAFEAIRRLEDSGLSVECRVIGDPDYGEGKRQAFFAALDLGVRNVKFLGALPQRATHGHVRWADVFLHAAVSEGFCNAVLEAQALGTPVVTSDAEGLAENVVDGVTGFVVPRRNAPALSEKVSLLSADPQLRDAMGAAGRRRARAEFRIGRQIDEFERLYLTLAEPVGRGERIRRIERAVRRIKEDERRVTAEIERARSRADDYEGFRRAVVSVTPENAVVAVVGKGDDSLTRLEGRTGWHFPRASDGTYCGFHPATGADAISYLSEVQRAGAGFLAFPRTSFWWLDHYGRLAQHLREQHTVVGDTDLAKVFMLRGNGGSLGAPERSRKGAA